MVIVMIIKSLVPFYGILSLLLQERKWFLSICQQLKTSLCLCQSKIKVAPYLRAGSNPSAGNTSKVWARGQGWVLGGVTGGHLTLPCITTAAPPALCKTRPGAVLWSEMWSDVCMGGGEPVNLCTCTHRVGGQRGYVGSQLVEGEYNCVMCFVNTLCCSLSARTTSRLFVFDVEMLQVKNLRVILYS